MTRKIGLSCIISILAFTFSAATVHAERIFTSDITPLNGSGVSGSAELVLNGDCLTVTIQATGLEPGRPHPQHIHGRFDAAGTPIDSVKPTPARDTDGDGFIELAEGLPDYGPVLISLTSPPGGAVANFPTAPEGTINFTQTYNLNDSLTFNAGFSKEDIFPLDFRELILHGLTVPAVGAGTPGEVDGTAGYKAVLPVASGLIEEVQPIPEPHSFLFLALGIGISGVMIYLRRRSHI